VGEMNVLYRVIARRRLTRASKIAPRMVFAILPDGRLSIIVGNKSPLVTKLDGTPIRFKNEAGQSIKLRRHFKNSVLSTVGDRGDAKQRLVYRLSGDLKRMTVRININSDPLPRPLRYSLTYRRQ